VSPVRYELGYIPKDSILLSRRRENLKSYTLNLIYRGTYKKET
jgi:hypothetical protein